MQKTCWHILGQYRLHYWKNKTVTRPRSISRRPIVGGLVWYLEADRSAERRGALPQDSFAGFGNLRAQHWLGEEGLRSRCCGPDKRKERFPSRSGPPHRRRDCYRLKGCTREATAVYGSAVFSDPIPHSPGPGLRPRSSQWPTLAEVFAPD